MIHPQLSAQLFILGTLTCYESLDEPQPKEASLTKGERAAGIYGHKQIYLEGGLIV